MSSTRPTKFIAFQISPMFALCARGLRGEGRPRPAMRGRDTPARQTTATQCHHRPSRRGSARRTRRRRGPRLLRRAHLPRPRAPGVLSAAAPTPRGRTCQGRSRPKCARLPPVLRPSRLRWPSCSENTRGTCRFPGPCRRPCPRRNSRRALRWASPHRPSLSLRG